MYVSKVIHVNITSSNAVKTRIKKLVLNKVIVFTLNSINSNSVNNNNHTISEKKKNL